MKPEIEQLIRELDEARRNLPAGPWSVTQGTSHEGDPMSVPSWNGEWDVIDITNQLVVGSTDQTDPGGETVEFIVKLVNSWPKLRNALKEKS